MPSIVCSNCGANWDTSDTERRFYFKPRMTGRQIVSPAEIAAAEVPMEFCPKCPIPRLDEAMRTGDRNPDSPERKEGEDR